MSSGLTCSIHGLDIAFLREAESTREIERRGGSVRQYNFVGGSHAPVVTDRQDRLKSMLKKFPRLYPALVSVLSPVLLHWPLIRRFERETRGVILNIGSGSQRMHPRHVNVDFFPYEEVDVVADLHALPFADHSVDAIITIAVLEHVRHPAGAVREMRRVLKPGGVVLALIPFMQPYHASPHDYQRYTASGIRELFTGFAVIRVCPAGGPVSGFLWVAQEFLAFLFSFGIPILRDVLLIGVMLVTWPVKYLDYLVRAWPTADRIASSFYFYGRLPALTSAPKETAQDDESPL